METIALCHGLSAVVVPNADGIENFWVISSKFLSERSFISMEQLKEEAMKAGALTLECSRGPEEPVMCSTLCCLARWMRSACFRVFSKMRRRKTP